MTEVAGLPSPVGHRTAADLFGVDDPSDSRPTWFDKDAFSRQDFDPEIYVADLRRFVPLDALRSELRSHLTALKNELLELINRDYADFVSLSTKLVDVDGSILRMRAPLTELRGKVAQFRSSVEGSLSSLHEGLRQRSEASAAREVLELLLDASHVISKVEKFLLELPSVPSDWSTSGTTVNDTSVSNVTAFTSQHAENGVNLRVTKSMLLERISSEMNRLNFYVSHAQNLPFIVNMEPRIRAASSSLKSSLNDCFTTALGKRDANAIYNCLRAYAAIDSTSSAEEIFRKTVVSPFIQQIIPQNPSQVGSGSSMDDLEEDYQKIRDFVTRDCRLLLEISSTANSGLHVFDFLANSVLKEVLLAIQKGKPLAFSAGKPRVFLKNYKSSLDFLAYLEGLCTSRSAVTEFRSRVVYGEFMKQWNTGVYFFSLRFQEIAGGLDSALTVPSSLVPVSEPLAKQGARNLMLKQSAMLMESLKSCWHEDVLLFSLSDKFLRLSLQLISRYGTWLSSGISAGKKGSAGSVDSEWGLNATPDDLVHVLHDVDQLVTEIKGRYLDQILELLKSCKDEILSLVRNSILQAGKSLQDIVPVLMDYVVEALVEKSVEDLRQIKGITATYRMTNKPPPVRHSPYVSGILRPLKDFLDGDRASLLTDKVRNELLLDVTEKITIRYNELAGELVSVARRTESSLMRIRQGALRRIGTSTDASENYISDTDKICMQLFLDVQEYGRNLSALGIRPADIPAYRSLWQCVAPPVKQEAVES